MQKWGDESFVDVVNLIFGAWLFAAPWLYGFASGAAGWNAWIMGALIALHSRPSRNGRSGSISCSAFGSLSLPGRHNDSDDDVIARRARILRESGAGRDRTVAGASQTAARPRLSGRRCKTRGPADTGPRNALGARRA